MKKVIKSFMALSFAFLLCVSSLGMNVKAETASSKVYTCTFRAGNVGSFDTTKVVAKDTTIASVSESYIKVNVNKGESLQSAMYRGFGVVLSTADDLTMWLRSGLKSNSEYGLLSADKWVTDCNDVLTDVSYFYKNVEYVLDYGVLVNPVSYTIYYVDEESGNSIAAPVMSYGSAGEEITAAPILVSEYATTNEAVTMKLDAEKENVIRFNYTFTGIIYIPGETTYETIYNYITEEQIVTLPAEVQGGVVPPANTVIDDENVPLVPGENDDQEDGDQDGNQDGDGDLTDIDDEETPLGDGGDETETETETKIDEVEVPLSWGAMIRANMGWIIGGAVALVLIVSGITVLIIRRKKQLKLKNMSSSHGE